MMDGDSDAGGENFESFCVAGDHATHGDRHQRRVAQFDVSIFSVVCLSDMVPA